jgi:3-dehydroquinate dehydratase/shikimate dehydrogenase
MTASVFGPDRICAVIAAPSAAEAIRQLRSAMGLRGRSRVLELRLDYLRDAEERVALLRWVSRHLARQQSHRASYQLAHQLPEHAARPASPQASMPTILAVCRTRRGGGQFAGSIKEEIAILAQAARAGCLWCDVEIETAERLVPAELRAALAPARVLVSAHDFRHLPLRLSALREKLFRFGGDAVKVAAACRSLADTRRLLDVVGERGDVIAIPMADKSAAGDAAAPRILALREGAALAYAAVDRTTAPGQLSLDATKHVYHLNRVFARNVAPRPKRESRANRAFGPSRDTRVYGVIGDPVAHSLSPLLHNTAFAARGIDAVYLPFHVQEVPRGNPRDLRDFLAAVKDFGISGFSVTLPHKQSILRYLDDCEPLAASIGAVNTVVVRDGRLSGYNTDYVGVLRSIESRISLRASRVLLLGAGGAARAAAFALARGGALVWIWARRRAQARALARAVGGEAIERSALRSESFDAVVNCTPVGMHSGMPGATRASLVPARASARSTSASSPLEPGELNCRVVMDLIYRPRKTELLYRAERRGIESISGVEMFLAQGIAQWEIWTGERAPRAAMRRAVIRALADEERVSDRPPDKTMDRTVDRQIDHTLDRSHSNRRNSRHRIAGRRNAERHAGDRRSGLATPPATV